MRPLYRVAWNRNVRNRAPDHGHMMDTPCPDYDHIGWNWDKQWPHCAALEETLHRWSPLEVVESANEHWGFFKVLPRSEEAAKVGGTQAVFNPDLCDIIEMSKEEFIEAVIASQEGTLCSTSSCFSNQAEADSRKV